MGIDMGAFKNFLKEADMVDAAKKRLRKMSKGIKVSFNHHRTGKKITGTYMGMKNMGGRSYAHVEHPKGVNHPNMIPVHHIHQAREK